MPCIRLSLALGLLIVSPALASAQLCFKEPTTQLGELRGGPTVQHAFEFVNESNLPVEIVDIRLGCGCLQPVLDKRTFEPAEKGTLLMHLRTLGQPDGPRTWQAFVKYRVGGRESELTLLLAAKIRNEVTVEPSIVAMSVETTLRQELIFTDYRPLPTKVLTVLASSPAIKVSMEPQGHGVTKVILEVSRAAMTAARQDETLSIYTDDPNYRQLQVPITLTKSNQPTVTATPAMVEIVGSGSQLVRLRARGDQVVRVQKIESDQPALQCTWASGPGNDATLKISVNAQRLMTPRTTVDVRVHLSEPSVMTLTIPLRTQKD